ncbi:MAG: PEPxxWA-CTERM sorting domain-containing protein [Sphingomonadaceae bacterium]|nr:PEPxxWA-CTERM sorting domain-containing protein [Sphingomonadaceae bacterium]
MRIVAGIVALALAAPAAAVTLDFESYVDETPIYSDGELLFNNLSSLDTRQLPNSGYANTVASGHNVVFNPSGRPTTITSLVPVRLISANLGAAWSDGLTVTFAGSYRGSAVYSQSFTVGTARSSFVAFNPSLVDSVVVTTVDGVHNSAFNPNFGKQFSLDNLSYSLAGASTQIAGTPEPASWALMIVGFGLIGVAARRRVPRAA